MFLFVLLLIAALLFFLARNGRLTPPPWMAGGRVGPHSPEFEARRILANRFATGEISSDEFLERAAALNWTPGIDHNPHQPGGKRG